jgi:hypothetical protein
MSLKAKRIDRQASLGFEQSGKRETWFSFSTFAAPRRDCGNVEILRLIEKVRY